MSTPPNPPSHPTEPSGTPIPPPQPLSLAKPPTPDAPRPAAPAPEPEDARPAAQAPAPAPQPLSLAKPPAPQPEDTPPSTPAPAPQPEDARPATAAAPAAPTPTQFAPLTPAPPAPPAPPTGAFGAPAPAAPWGTPGTPGTPAAPWASSGTPGAPASPWGAPGAYPGYPGYAGYPPPPPRAATNGMAIAALVLGLVAVPLSFTPFFFWAGTLLGLAGLGIGIAALVTASRGAPRKTMALVGTILSVLSLFGTAGGYLLTVRIVDHPAHRTPHRTDDDWSIPDPDDSPTPAFPDMGPTTGPGISTPLPFGQTFTYPSGAKVSLSVPKPYETKSSFMTVDNAVRIDITISNTSDKPLNVIYAQPLVTTESGDAGRLVFDGTMPKSISGTIEPGGVATGSAAFEVPEGTKNITAKISPAILLSPAQFSGPIG